MSSLVSVASTPLPTQRRPTYSSSRSTTLSRSARAELEAAASAAKALALFPINTSPQHEEFWQNVLTLDDSEIEALSQTQEFAGHVWAGIPNDLRPELWKKALHRISIGTSSDGLSEDMKNDVRSEAENCSLCDAFEFTDLSELQRAYVEVLLNAEAKHSQRSSVREGSGGLVARIAEVINNLDDGCNVFATIIDHSSYLWNVDPKDPKTPAVDEKRGDGISISSLLLADAISHYQPLTAVQLRELSFDVHDLSYLIRLLLLPLLSGHFPPSAVYRAIDIALFDTKPHALLGIISGFLTIALSKFQKFPLPPPSPVAGSAVTTGASVFFSPASKSGQSMVQALNMNPSSSSSSLTFSHQNSGDDTHINSDILQTHFLSFLTAFPLTLTDGEIDSIFTNGYCAYRIHVAEISKWEPVKNWKRAVVREDGPLMIETCVGTIPPNSFDSMYCPAPTDYEKEISVLTDELSNVRAHMIRESRPRPPSTPAPPGARKGSILRTNPSICVECSNTMSRSNSAASSKSTTSIVTKFTFPEVSEPPRSIPEKSTLAGSNPNPEANQTILELQSTVNLYSQRILLLTESLNRSLEILKNNQTQDSSSSSQNLNSTIESIEQSLKFTQYPGPAISLTMNSSTFDPNLQSPTQLDSPNPFFQEVPTMHHGVILYTDIAQHLSFPCIHFEGYLQRVRTQYKNMTLEQLMDKPVATPLYKRYFVLQGPFLVMFKNHNASSPSNNSAVDIRGRTISQINDSPFGKFAIEIKTLRGTEFLTLFAASESDRSRWMTTLVAAAKLPLSQ